MLFKDILTCTVCLSLYLELNYNKNRLSIKMPLHWLFPVNYIVIWKKFGITLFVMCEIYCKCNLLYILENQESHQCVYRTLYNKLGGGAPNTAGLTDVLICHIFQISVSRTLFFILRDFCRSEPTVIPIRKQFFCGGHLWLILTDWYVCIVQSHKTVWLMFIPVPCSFLPLNVAYFQVQILTPSIMRTFTFSG